MTGTKLDESAFCDKCGEHKDQAHTCWNTESPAEVHRRAGRPYCEKHNICWFIGLGPDPGCPRCREDAQTGAARTVMLEAPTADEILVKTFGPILEKYTPVRAQCLQECIALTTGGRNKTYGPLEPNLTLQMELWTLYKRAAGDKHSMAHDAAMQHVFAKLARIASGPLLHEDNYVDLSTYSAIAYECDVEVLGAPSC